MPEIDLSLRDKAGLSPFATALTFRNNKAAQAILDKMPSAAEQVSNIYYILDVFFFKKINLKSLLIELCPCLQYKYNFSGY